MKLKALLLALFVAGLSASYALADDGHGKHGGKGRDDDERTTTVRKTAACKPGIELELRGTVAGPPTTTAVALLVSKGSGGGASLAGKQLTLDTTGASKPASLASGAAVRVHARACVDIVARTVTLVATQIRLSDDAQTTSTTTTVATTTR